MVSAIGVGTEIAGTIFSWTGAGAVVAGAAAGVSAAADITNSIRMAARGDLLKAGMYAIFAVPIFGDTLQGVKVLELVGEGGVKIIGKFIKFAKTKRATKAVVTVHELIDKASEDVPEVKKHKTVIKNSAEIIMSGDAEEIARLAEKSGDAELAKNIREKYGASDRPEKEISEARRSRSLIPLYGETLYN